MGLGFHVIIIGYYNFAPNGANCKSRRDDILVEG